jgi:hypothetical protein
VRYTSWCSQVADGNPRGWWIGSDGTRQGNEVIVPLLIADPESGQTPDQGISISNIYTWISYPPGRSGPPGGVVSECDITITAAPGNPMVSFIFAWEPVRR